MNILIFTISCLIVLSTCFKEHHVIKKTWWAPWYGIMNEGLWIAFILIVGSGSWPILLACGFYIYNDTKGIRSGRWKRNDLVQ